jgi:hypothetical protein
MINTVTAPDLGVIKGIGFKYIYMCRQCLTHFEVQFMRIFEDHMMTIRWIYW